MFILYILLFNRYVVINHTNICLDPNFFKKNILHVLISKKISAKFRPNFTKFGNFGGGRNFGDTEIKNLAGVYSSTIAGPPTCPFDSPKIPTLRRVDHLNDGLPCVYKRTVNISGDWLAQNQQHRISLNR